jgi:LuxR family transcriptional regulator, maltose regulon positive regulatory protein
MDIALVATKICAPRLRTDLVKRKFLVERLKAGLHYPLTLVSAPAGYGKTTLLAELASQIPVAWLSLDEGDNDPVRFWTHFTAALRIKQPGLGNYIFQTLASIELPPIRSLLIELINELSQGASPPQPYVIILDDYHLIKQKDIHNDMAFLIEHLPEQLHLIISTRSDPSLPMARMRARGQLSEFRAHDLRFTLEETDTILNGLMGLGLSEDDIETLDIRTEGWIASLQMAAISMRKHNDIPAFIAAFKGTHRHVLDYLTGEVLSQQTEDIRSFLIKTSILNHLNGPLCDAVTGRNDGHDMLEQLEAANLFIMPLDEERKWYRYHHLFSSLLVSRLQQQYPQLILELNKKAADWFHRNGLIEEAITYALAARDFDLSAQLIDFIRGEYLIRSEQHTLMNWLSKLPPLTFTKHPALAEIYATFLSHTGQIDKAETWLNKIDGLTLPLPNSLSASLGMAHIAIAHQDDRKASALLKSIIENKEDVGDVSTDPVATLCLSQKLFAGFLLGQLYKAHGNLSLAVETCLGALNTHGSDQLKDPWSITIGMNHLLLAESLYEFGELEKAMYQARTASEIAHRVGDQSFIAIGLTVMQLIQQAMEGNEENSVDQASEILISEVSSGKKEGYLSYPTVVLPVLMRTFFAKGDLKAIIQCMSSFQLIADLDKWRAMYKVSLNEPIDTAIAYYHLAAGKTGKAEELLGRLQQNAEKADRNGNLVEILLLRALAIQATGNIPKAVDHVVRALQLAEPEGFIRIFIDLGAPIAALLKEAARRNIAPDYVHRLLTEFTKKGISHPPANPQVPPLTSRELEILRLFAEDLSNREIAQKLVITLGTVKAHTHNIYSKLEVGSRTGAVKRAINLNLI